MGLLKRLGRVGDSITLMLFSDNFKNVTFTHGYTKLGRYAHNYLTKEGIELNLSEPINELNRGKFKRQIYPAYYDNASGFKLVNKSDKLPFWKGKEVRYFRRNENGGIEQVQPTYDLQGDESRIELYTECFDGVPIEINGETRLFRAIQFILSPLVVKIIQDPRVVGSMVDSNIFGDAVQLNPAMWKYAVVGVIFLLIGLVF